MVVIIPVGFAQYTQLFDGPAVPEGAAVTFGVELEGIAFGEIRVQTIKSAFVSAFTPFMSDDVNVAQGILKYGPNTTGPVFTSGGSDPGDSSDPPAPPNTAFLIRKSTALGGRANRGRFYLPGVTEATVDMAGNVDPSFALGLTTAATTFLNDLATSEMSMVILHNGPSAPTVVSGLVCDSRVATQRNRLR